MTGPGEPSQFLTRLRHLRGRAIGLSSGRARLPVAAGWRTSSSSAMTCSGSATLGGREIGGGAVEIDVGVHGGREDDGGGP